MSANGEPLTATTAPRSAALPLPDVPMAAGDVDSNPAGIGLVALLVEDFQTHGSDPLSAGFWTLAFHRLGNARMSIRHKWLRVPATLAYRSLHRAGVVLWGIDLPYNMKIGRRFRLGHHGCVHIGAREIGDDVIIRHSVTIGLLRHKTLRFPKIGNRVEVGPGAAIVGAVDIGDDCFIGANTVVGRDLPDGVEAIGIPLRIRKR
ncbi:MAG TPA: serine acetyltransferase [Polyangia bacterium]